VELAVNAGASRKHIERRTRTTAGQAGISGRDIKQMPIPLPPVREQQRISEEVESLLSVATNTTAQTMASTHRCTRLRQSILKWAFEGKLADQDPCDEPASALLERIRSQTHASRPSTGDTGNKRPRRSSRRQSVRAENTR
jgi:type I restriction enzyme S subunit